MNCLPQEVPVQVDSVETIMYWDKIIIIIIILNLGAILLYNINRRVGAGIRSAN